MLLIRIPFPRSAFVQPFMASANYPLIFIIAYVSRGFGVLGFWGFGVLGRAHLRKAYLERATTLVDVCLIPIIASIHI